MTTSTHAHHFAYGSRVRFMGPAGDSRSGQECKIIKVLPNPSGRPEHQWYDVKFADSYIARFPQKYLTDAKEISAADWAKFFESLSRRHENQLVRLDIFDRDQSRRLATRLVRLKSISAEDLENKMIIIIGEDGTTEVSQLVRTPTHVLLNSTGESLEIHSDDLLMTMRFLSPGLPEVIDGAA